VVSEEEWVEVSEEEVHPEAGNNNCNYSVMGKKFKFTKAQKSEIESAVKNLEARTSGEMVPYIVPGSDIYVEGTLYTIISFLIMGIVLVMGASLVWLLPHGVTIIEIMIFLIIMMFLGFIISFVFPSFRIQMVSNTTVERRVMQRAETAFLEREVFKTGKRIGILLFISELEKKVLILADSGINRLVPGEEWQIIVDELIGNIKKKNTAKGIVKAIDQCTALLIKSGVENDEMAGNQLPDGLVESE
jgi:putative membrane protein